MAFYCTGFVGCGSTKFGYWYFSRHRGNTATEKRIYDEFVVSVINIDTYVFIF